MQPLQIFAGLGLLAFGRKLFWLLAGAAVFYFSYRLASQHLPEEPAWLPLLAAAGAGLAAALLAVTMQSLAVGLAGFAAGGTLMYTLVQGAGIDLGPFSWFVFAAGGLAGGFLVLWLLEWALILLSSFTGALLVMQRTPLDSFLSAFLFFALFVTGFGFQFYLFQKEHNEEQMRD